VLPFLAQSHNSMVPLMLHAHTGANTTTDAGFLLCNG
jgi:hypothetical protein